MLSGKGLYQVNNVVDVNNLVSSESFQPLGAYDLDQVRPPIQLRIGALGETYKGIGKDLINIESLPVFADGGGAFGSPTSDSYRGWSTYFNDLALMEQVGGTQDKGVRNTDPT